MSRREDEFLTIQPVGGADYTAPAIYILKGSGSSDWRVEVVNHKGAPLDARSSPSLAGALRVAADRLVDGVEYYIPQR